MDVKKLTRFVLKDKMPINSSVFYYVSLLVVAIITFYPFFGTGIASADDITSYTVARFGTQFSTAKYLALMSGRFYYLIVAPFHNISYIVDNQFVIKLFQVIPIWFCLFLFYRIVLIITKSKELSALFVLLFFIIAQISSHTSLFVTYPFYFTFSFSLLLLSTLLIFHFQKRNKYLYLIYSAVLYAFGLLFYEVYILFIWFAFLSIIYHNVKGGFRGKILIRNIILQVIPFVVVVIGYLSAYVAYGYYHPSEYAGTQLSGNTITLASFFTVLWKLSWTAFPLTVYDATHVFLAYKSEMITGYQNIVPYLFSYAHIDWIVKSILVFCMSYFLLLRIPKVPYKTILVGFLLAVMITFFPHIPLALTVKYTYYVMSQTMLGYITTFYSLFGVLLFLTMASALILNFSDTFTFFRHITAFIIAVGFVFCAFLTDFSNYYVARDIHHANVRLYTVDELIKSDQFKAIPQSSNIYSAELWQNPYLTAGGLTEQGFQWTYYISCKSHIYQLMIRDKNEFLKKTKNTTDPGYRIMYKQAYKSDDALLALAQLKIPKPTDTLVSPTSDKILVVFYSKYKQFSVSFKRTDEFSRERAKIKINQINDEIEPGNYVEFTIFNTKLNQPATIFTIEASSIDIKSIEVSNLINPDSKVFYL
jgi:hypothetical protein